jgi:enoyl-CoA hydratase/carnithine racemase
MALTGDMIDAQEALACGLVSKVVPDSDLLVEARKLADRIAVNPTQAVRMTKRLLWESRSINLDTLLELSAAMQAIAHTTDDNREAITAFLEKRKPNFIGK